MLKAAPLSPRQPVAYMDTVESELALMALLRRRLSALLRRVTRGRNLQVAEPPSNNVIEYSAQLSGHFRRLDPGFESP